MGLVLHPMGHLSSPKWGEPSAPFANLIQVGTVCPTVADPAPLAAGRLRAAIDASPYSIRSLSRALAERPDVEAQPESIRRSIGKWLDGEPISSAWGSILEDQLGLAAGTLIVPGPSRAISLAGELVRRLEAGEHLPPARLLAVAEATERAGAAAILLAGRLRREAAAHG